MSITFINRTSRVAIAGRVAEWRRQPQNWNELNMLGDYHLPFGKAEETKPRSGSVRSNTTRSKEGNSRSACGRGQCLPFPNWRRRLWGLTLPSK